MDLYEWNADLALISNISQKFCIYLVHSISKVSFRGISFFQGGTYIFRNLKSASHCPFPTSIKPRDCTRLAHLWSTHVCMSGRKCYLRLLFVPSPWQSWILSTNPLPPLVQTMLRACDVLQWILQHLYLFETKTSGNAKEQNLEVMLRCQPGTQICLCRQRIDFANDDINYSDRGSESQDRLCLEIRTSMFEPYNKAEQPQNQIELDLGRLENKDML